MTMFLKIKSLNFLTIRGSCGSKDGEKITEFGFDLKFNFALLI